jgi:WD40 repeat protein
VAYRSGRDLRVVAGDGTGDHLLAGPVAPIAPAWRPGSVLYPLAYVSSGGALVIRDGDTGRLLWMTKPRMAVKQLVWSADGQRLLAVGNRAVAIYDSRGKLLATHASPDGAPIVDTALSPDGLTLALVLGGAGGAVVTERVDALDPPVRRELSGSGLRQVAWSPDGRWLLASWPAANQWVFIRVAGKPRISAVSRIAQQFSPSAASRFPRLDGWCCAVHGSIG